MPRRRHLFEQPDRFVAGTVGEPGNRTFFLQARDGRRVVSVSLEKVQVVVLAQRLDELLDELAKRGVDGAAEDERERGDTEPLDEPLNEAFRTGTMAIGWDGGDGRILVEARELTDDEGEPEVSDEEILADDDDEGPDVLRVRLLPEAARRFVAGALRVVARGRPPCPLCGEPLDPRGHLCPRRNGHRLN